MFSLQISSIYDTVFNKVKHLLLACDISYIYIFSCMFKFVIKMQKIKTNMELNLINDTVDQRNDDDANG